VSRSKKGGSRNPCNEYEGKRPYSWSLPRGKETKQLTHQKERAELRQEIRKQAHESEFDVQEIEPCDNPDCEICGGGLK
jgi:hypothetical protein